MKTILSALALLAGLLVGSPASSGEVPPPSKEASGIARLLEGNARYVAGDVSRPHQDLPRRAAVASLQSPFAIVVSCSDSRVPPELVFDQGLGDLFVVRTAGHVVDSIALGSIEFAVAKLGARSILVLGHERCGAVQAALEHVSVPGSIGSILAAIQPAVGGPEAATPQALERAVSRNARAVADRLRAGSPILEPLIANKSLEIAHAVYDLDSGKIVLGAKADAR